MSDGDERCGSCWFWDDCPCGCGYGVCACTSSTWYQCWRKHDTRGGEADCGQWASREAVWDGVSRIGGGR